ncbi:hypothetical protein H3V53_39150 [Paraburkholderia bengalensis]|uniref:Phage shock protein A (PspA) family protein n=1 Tax=Paraburkholderia bengalensis TaxID=2747562 RepID=A0ABU8J5E5_9BURK
MVIALAQTIRIGHRAAVHAIDETAVAVAELREVIDNSEMFREFCHTHFNFSKTTTYRYARMGVIVRAHFLTEDGQLITDITNIHFFVFNMLSDDLDPEVFEKVKLLASQGKVTKSDDEEVISCLKGQLSAKSEELLEAAANLANTEARLVEADRLLISETARADRNQIQERETAAAVSRLEAEVQAYQQDIAQMEQTIATLQSTTAEVWYETVTEIRPPEGYTSNEAAIAAIEAMRKTAERELADAQARLGETKTQLEQLQTAAVSSRAAQQTLAELSAAVDEITRKFPLDILTNARDHSPDARASILAAATQLRALGDLLMKAGNGDA